MTDIICPHCGGLMQIDHTLRLQGRLSCPYCGRKSLMQKTADGVQLRGIILPSAPGESEPDGSEGRTLPATSDKTWPLTPEPAAQAMPTAAQTPLPVAQAPSAAVIQPVQTTVPLHLAEPGAEPAVERLVRQARQALAAGQMLAFNSYARQAIDCDPLDPRMYVVRARLVEEAHGFARATFLAPGWTEQTPRQRSWILAQHFATLGAAVACSPESEHDALASQAGSLIARQIRDTFMERARLRLGRKAFRGRYARADLWQTDLIVETCLAIDETILPRISSRLVRAIREELARLDPVLARHLKRHGF